MTFDEVLRRIDIARQRKLTGNYNCIPWCFPKFSYINPGLQKAKYYIVTGNTKAGKSQLADEMFVFDPIRTVHLNPNVGIKLDITYFSLEMTEEEKNLQLISHSLYRSSGGQIRIRPSELMSIGKDVLLPSSVRTKIDEIKSKLDVYSAYLTYVTDIRNPYGIYKRCVDDLMSKGKLIDVTTSDGMIRKKYIPNDLDLYNIYIIDNANILSTEKNAPTIFAAIAQMSKYNIILRNLYGASTVLIQQQDPGKESASSVKAKMTEPSLDGLRDNKSPAMDANLILGIYSPYRNKISPYYNYDITKYRDHYRSLKILGGRSGGIGTVTSLYFDGAVNYFKELPPAGQDNQYLELIKTLTN